MRKLLISILIALLLAITVYSVYKGLSIGNIKILGFGGIKAESQNLDNQIEEVTKLKEQEYKKTLTAIESNAKLLLQEKEKYATVVSTSTESEIKKATHNQKYEQDFLWAKVGNHATSQGVKLKFDIAVGAINKENYDLSFTVEGKYTNITEFVMAIENDNLLGFKIENFKMIPVPEKEEEENSENKGKNTTSNTTTNTNSDNTNSDNTNTNTNTNTTSDKKSEGELQATFKVYDVQINIDKTKINTNRPNMQNEALEEEAVENAVQVTNTTTTEGSVE